MEDDDVTWPNPWHERRRVVGQRVLIDPAGLCIEWNTVALEPVQPVVDALGHAVESRGAVDDDPAGIETHATCIADERAEELDDSAAACGRVHVPDCAPGE